MRGNRRARGRLRRCVGAVVTVLLVAAGATLLPAPVDRQAHAVVARPNILLFMSDDQADGTLSAMPTVRWLQSIGTSYTRYFDSFPLCCPTRAAVLTGQYSHNSGVWSNGPPDGGYPALQDKDNTIAAWLHDGGYQTAILGKILNGYHYAVDGVPAGWDFWRVAEDPIYDYYDTRIRDENGVSTDYPDAYKTETYTSLALDLIDELDPTRPWFLWLSPNAPHAGKPFDTDDSHSVPTCSPSGLWRDRYEGTRLPHPAQFNEKDVSDKPRHIRDLPPLTKHVQRAIVEAYSQQLECLRSLDTYLARVIAHLAEIGELADTDIIYVSDNGWAFGEHRVPAGKSLPYDYAARLPLVAAGPDFPPAVDRRPRSSVDLAATITDLAGVTPPYPLDGTSLRTAVDPNRPILHEGKVAESAGVHYGISRYAGIRLPSWFYAQYLYDDGTSDAELYNLVSDPGELQSLHGDPQFAVFESALAGLLAKYRFCAGPTCP